MSWWPFKSRQREGFTRLMETGEVRQYDCDRGRHQWSQWSKWGEVKREAFQMGNHKLIPGYRLFQQRQCSLCGFLEETTLS